MPSGLILAIDQGTTNTKALLLNRSGVPVFVASAPVGLIHSELGHVEQDPEQVWHSVLRVIAESVRHASQSGDFIEALAISNQRETAIAWDAATGAPISNAISWQCPRSAEICRRLAPHAELIRAKTGLPLATLISAGKWAWLMENDSNVQTLSEAGDPASRHRRQLACSQAHRRRNARHRFLQCIANGTAQSRNTYLGCRSAGSLRNSAACDAGTAILLGIVRSMLGCSRPRWRPDSGGDRGLARRNVWSRAIHSGNREGNVRNGFVTDGIDAGPPCGYTRSGANHCLVDWRQDAVRPRRKHRHDRLSSAMGGGVSPSPRSGARSRRPCRNRRRCRRRLFCSGDGGPGSSILGRIRARNDHRTQPIAHVGSSCARSDRCHRLSGGRRLLRDGRGGRIQAVPRFMPMAGLRATAY